jgi:hypothetical protein
MKSLKKKHHKKFFYEIYIFIELKIIKYLILDPNKIKRHQTLKH